MIFFIPKNDKDWDFTAFMFYDNGGAYGVSFNGVVHYIEPSQRHAALNIGKEVSFEEALQRLLSKYEKKK